MDIAFVTLFFLSSTHPPQADSIGGAGVTNSSELMKWWLLFPLQVTIELLFFRPCGNSTFCWFIIWLTKNLVVQEFKQHSSWATLFLIVLIAKVNESEGKRDDDTFGLEFRYRKVLEVYFVSLIKRRLLLIKVKWLMQLERFFS